MLKRKGFCAKLILVVYVYMVSLLSMNGTLISQYNVSAAGTYTLNESFDYPDYENGVTGTALNNAIPGWAKLNNANTSNGNTYSIKDGAMVVYNTASQQQYMQKTFSSITGTDVVVRFKLHFFNTLPGYDNTNFFNISDGSNNLGTFGFVNTTGNGTFKFSWSNQSSTWPGTATSTEGAGLVANHEYTVRYDISFGATSIDQGTVSCTVTDVTPGLATPSSYKWENKPFKNNTITNPDNSKTTVWNTSANQVVIMFGASSTSISIDDLQVYHSTTTPDLTATTSLDSASTNVPVNAVISANFSEDLDLSTVDHIKVMDSDSNIVLTTVSAISIPAYMKQRKLNITFPAYLKSHSNYTLVIPATVKNVFGDGLASDKTVVFSTGDPISKIRVSNEQIVDGAGAPLQTLTPSAQVAVQADVVNENTDPNAQKNVNLILTLTDNHGILQSVVFDKKTIQGGQPSQPMKASFTLPSTLPSDVTGWHLNAFVWGEAEDPIVSKYKFPAM